MEDKKEKAKKFLIEIDRQWSEEIRNLLKQKGVYGGDIIEKALNLSDIVRIVVAEVTHEIINFILEWYKEKKKKEKDIKMRIFKYNETKCSVVGKEIKNFETKSIKEIENDLKE